MLDMLLPSPLTAIADDRLAAAGLRLLLKRDDLIHPDFPGNKWRKLRHNLTAASDAGLRTLLTFGGAWSNHIQATAAAGHHFGFRTIGVIRGEERPTPALARAEAHGMTLTYVSRGRYRGKNEPAFRQALQDQFGDFFLIPEGGANTYAVQGCAELPAEIDAAFDVLCCATGTGATLAGVAAGLAPGQRALGFAVLKGGDFLSGEVARLQGEFGRATGNWSVSTEFHFGGFARRTRELDLFVEDFEARHGIVLDRVYEAKMMYGLFTLAARGSFHPGRTLVALLA